MSSISGDDSGGAVAGVVRPPLSVSLSIAPLLAWIKGFKVIGKQHFARSVIGGHGVHNYYGD
jgi:hypothetical protein